jgi:hypothetical protein
MPRLHPVRRHPQRRSRQTCAGAERTPLELVAWLEARYRALIDAEEAKGARGNPARVDAALQAIAGLVRTAAPYRHARIRPAEQASQDNTRRIFEFSWTPPTPRKLDGE